MVSIPEIVTWALGLVVFIYGVTQFSYVQRLIFYPYLVVSYSAMMLAWTLTILEEFFWGDLLNILEHGFQLLSVIMLSVWCYRIIWKVRNGA